MLGAVMHIGLTVSSMDRSIEFYKEVLGLHFEGEILMEGKETDLLFQRENTRARVAYLKGTDEVISPSIELIQFIDTEIEHQNTELFRTSVSEICFYVKDIEALYRHLKEQNVECLSAPQSFDFTKDGFGKSKAIYFRDPDGIILEAMEPVKE